jgi:hypothetical protein
MLMPGDILCEDFSPVGDLICGVQRAWPRNANAHLNKEEQGPTSSNSGRSRKIVDNKADLSPLPSVGVSEIPTYSLGIRSS